MSSGLGSMSRELGSMSGALGSMSRALRVIGALALGLSFAADAQAQGLYKYRDDAGNWVYTDRRPDDGRDVEQLPLTESMSVPEVIVSQRRVESHIEIVASNGCFCPAEVAVKLLERNNIDEATPPLTRVVAGARRETVILKLMPANAAEPLSAGFQYMAVLGEPDAPHRAVEPYRAPFALARTFTITQAAPSRITHVDVASHFAVDIDMPVGTQIYAAREGTVIEVASRNFEGGTDLRHVRNANIVRVLHPDGTMALYAHLNWDSIRVKPGQVVRRGEYIADSGNTGFTSGPHLHFAVQRNVGLRLESLPVEFSGPGGARVEARTGETLTAY